MKRMMICLMAAMLTACASSRWKLSAAPMQTLQTQPSVALTPCRTMENHQNICQLLETTAEKYGAMGVQLAILEKGEVVDSFAWGWAIQDVEPMSVEHKLRIASLSKIALGLATQLLQEEGVVELDRDIGQYWGVTLQRPVTLQHILTHTSCVKDYATSASREYADVKNRLQKGGFSGATPGDMDDWHYNNYAFAVLGMTLELAAGETVDEVLHRRLYQHMDIDAAFAGGHLQNREMIATLYRSGGVISRTAQMQSGMTRDNTPGATGTYFAGGMLCSAYDFAKLLSLLAKDGSYQGQSLMMPQSIASMERRMDMSAPDGSYQAHPMRARENLYGRSLIFYHTGSAYGVYNCASYDPNTGDGVVVLTTGASGSKDKYGIYKICAELNSYIYPLLAD